MFSTSQISPWYFLNKSGLVGRNFLIGAGSFMSSLVVVSDLEWTGVREWKNYILCLEGMYCSDSTITKGDHNWHLDCTNKTAKSIYLFHKIMKHGLCFMHSS